MKRETKMGRPTVMTNKQAKNNNLVKSPNKRGRPKGSQNKTTTLLKDAILLAAEKTGLDQKGKDGLTGYLQFLAKEEPKAFSQLLGRVLPLQVVASVTHHQADVTDEIMDPEEWAEQSNPANHVH